MKRAKPGTNREVDKVLKKLALGRATTGTVDATQEATALLVLAGRFDEALRISKRLAGAPKSVYRLVTDAWDTSYFPLHFHLLAAATASPAMMKELGLSAKDIAADVAAERARFANNRAHHRAEPGSYMYANRKTTKLV